MAKSNTYITNINRSLKEIKSANYILSNNKGIIITMSGTVHTGVEVRRMDLEISRLVERPWLQLMCCAVCLPCGRNFG